MNKDEFIEKFKNDVVTFEVIRKSWLYFENKTLGIEIVAPYENSTWYCHEEEEIWKFDGFDFLLDDVNIYVNGDLLK